MKIKKPIIYGLIGALSLLGCSDSNKEKPKQDRQDWVYRETFDGFRVKGTFVDEEITFWAHMDKGQPSISLRIENDHEKVWFSDHYRIDGNVNTVSTPVGNFFYKDDGTLEKIRIDPSSFLDFGYRGVIVVNPQLYEKGTAREDTEKLREWANHKLKKVQKLVIWIFGDKSRVSTLKALLESEKDSIDEIIEESDF